MNTYSPKNHGNRDGAVASARSAQQKEHAATFQFNDNRPETLAQRKLQQSTWNSPQLKHAQAIQAMADRHSFNSNRQNEDRNEGGFTAVYKNGFNSDRLNGARESNARQSAPAAQAFFNLAEFEFAKNAFAVCHANAVRFNSQLNDIDSTYLTEMEGGNTLKSNIEAKGRKASGTVSGESFESREWYVDHECDVPHIIGPGGGDGIDLKQYYLEIEELDDTFMEIDEFETERRVEILDTAGEAYAEVKSARSQATFLDGVGSALNDNNANLIIVYAPANIVPAVNHTFTRSANNFVIRAEGNRNYLTFRADIKVKDFDGDELGDLTVHNN